MLLFDISMFPPSQLLPPVAGITIRFVIPAQNRGLGDPPLSLAESRARRQN